MKSITYIYAQFTKRELYPVAWASNRGLHPVTWALRKNVDSVLLFGFQNIRKKFGQCFVIWVSKRQLTDCTGILKKEIYQPVFGTSEGYVDSISDFRRMCRWYFGLQKDVQTVFWTSESIFRWHRGPQKCLGVGFLASEKSYIDSIIMDLTLCHRVYYGLNTLPQSC